MSLLLTPVEAARELRVSRTKVFELMRTRQLRSVLIGTHGRRIPRQALEDFIADLAEREG